MTNLILSIVFTILGSVILVADLMTGASITCIVLAGLIILSGIIGIILDAKILKKSKSEKER